MSDSSTHLAIVLLTEDTGAGLLMCCKELREHGEAGEDALKEEHSTLLQQSVEAIAGDLVDGVQQRQGVNGWLGWVSPVATHHSQDLQQIIAGAGV